MVILFRLIKTSRIPPLRSLQRGSQQILQGKVKFASLRCQQQTAALRKIPVFQLLRKIFDFSPVDINIVVNGKGPKLFPESAIAPEAKLLSLNASGLLELPAEFILPVFLAGGSLDGLFFDELLKSTFEFILPMTLSGGGLGGLGGLFGGIAQSAILQGGQQVTVAGLPSSVTPDGVLNVPLEDGSILSFTSSDFDSADAALSGFGDLVNDYPVAEINAALQ